MRSVYLAARFTGLLAIVVVMLRGGSAQAADSPPATVVNPALDRSPARIAQLIRQLGDNSYLARQKASRELIDIGIVARDALTAACKDSDAEIRTRANLVLASVIEADFQSRLEAFAADVEDSRKITLPGWNQFRSQLGDDRTARMLFVDMQRSESSLLEAYEAGPKVAAEVFAARSMALQQALQWNPTGQNPATITLGSVATLLLVGSDAEVPVDEQAGAQLFTFIHQQGVQEGIRGVQSSRIKKLLGKWITKNNGQSIDFQNLMLAFNFELKEGLPLALRMLTNDGGQPHIRQYAILAVGKFGDKSHVAQIEPLLKDATPCLSQRVNDRDVQTQIRDVALAVLVSLTGQSFKDYGFDHVQASQQLLFQPGTLGFSEPAKRDAALKKWAAWSAEHPK